MENLKKYKWHLIAVDESELHFKANNLLEIEVAGRSICIVRGKETLYACTNKCPHAGGVIADGYIDGLNNVVCPLHRYRFDLKNGRNVSGEGYYLKTYPLQRTEEGIFIGIEEKGNFFW